MSGRSPSIEEKLGLEDVPLLIEVFASFFSPDIKVVRGQIANIQLNFSGGQLNTMAMNPPGVQVINRGSGYTFASAQVLGNTGIVESGTTAQANNANVTPIIGPPGGHGSDPINELYADTVGVSVDFVDDEGGNTPAQNDFRTVGILKDPLFANVVLTMNTSTSNSGTSFTAGEKVTQDSNSTHGGAFGFITSRASGTLNLANYF